MIEMVEMLEMVDIPPKTSTVDPSCDMPVAGCSLIRPCKMPPVDMCIFDLGEAWPR